jgi:hypothetical protein
MISISLPQSQMRLVKDSLRKVDFSKLDNHPERSHELKAAVDAAICAVLASVEDLYLSTFK